MVRPTCESALTARSGTVESKVRQLVMKIEQCDGLLLAHPFVKGIDRVFYCLNDVEGRAITSGGVISPELGQRTEADIEGKPDALRIYTTNFFIGMLIETKPKGVSAPDRARRMLEPAGSGPTRRLDISYPTSEFIKLAKMWEPFDLTTMGIIVRYIKSAALPDYVFEGLEKPPPASRALKRPNAVRRIRGCARCSSRRRRAPTATPLGLCRTRAAALVSRSRRRGPHRRSSRSCCREARRPRRPRRRARPRRHCRVSTRHRPRPRPLQHLKRPRQHEPVRIERLRLRMRPADVSELRHRPVRRSCFLTVSCIVAWSHREPVAWPARDDRCLRGRSLPAQRVRLVASV